MKAKSEELFDESRKIRKSLNILYDDFPVC